MTGSASLLLPHTSVSVGHPMTLAPPCAGPLRLPNCECTSWDSCKTTVSKVVKEAPAADDHSHTLTQREPSIYRVFVDKPPLVCASSLNVLGHLKFPPGHIPVTSSQFPPFKMVSMGPISPEVLQRILSNAKSVSITDPSLSCDKTHQFTNLNYSDPHAAPRACTLPTQSHSVSMDQTRLHDPSYFQEHEDAMDHSSPTAMGGCVDLEPRDIGHEETVDEVSKQNRRVLHEHKSDTTMSRTVVTDGSPSNRNPIAPSTLLLSSPSPLPCMITPSDTHSTAFRALETDSLTGSLVCGTPCPTH